MQLIYPVDLLGIERRINGHSEGQSQLDDPTLATTAAEALTAHRTGRLTSAEELYRKALAASPDDARTLHRLGLLLHEMGRDLEAVPLLCRSIELKPNVGGYHCNLAAVAGTLGHHGQAAEHLKRAAEIDPTIPEVHHNLGVALEHLGKLREAEASHREALRLRPGYPEAHNHLGAVLRKLGRTSEAAECHNQAIAIRPSYAEAYNNLAAALREQGDQPGAVASQRKAVELQPANAGAHSALLYMMHYDPASTPGMLLEEAKEWDRRHGGNFTAGDGRATSKTANTAPARPDCATRLRVGYVSPDFREHTVPRLIAPVLRHHDRSQVEVFCYSAVRNPDRVTERLKGLADVWRDISHLTDDASAELIWSDRIDILVDLAGHWADNRMTLMARKPAPVQVQVGYPGTTGLSAIDYRITDEWSDPPGAETFYAEKLWRMPRCAWCYEPDEDSPAVGPPPALSAGQVTFGCLNNPVKVTDQCLRLWGRILESVSGSRLLLLSAEGRENKALLDWLKRAEIDPARVEPVRRQPRRQYLELFNHIDIALDPFPYNGETTTCDGLWMGVPHVALAGDRCASRRGVSHLNNLGLGELVASSEDTYVGIATTLAGDLRRLAELRASMRERMLRSPMMDYAGYIANLEAAYRQIWRAWCEDSDLQRTQK